MIAMPLTTTQTTGTTGTSGSTSTTSPTSTAQSAEVDIFESAGDRNAVAGSHIPHGSAGRWSGRCCP